MHALWCIYYVKNCTCTRPNKDKFVAIVCSETNPMGFIINTRIHPFILERPDLSSCQVAIKVSDYAFLDHDSYINCIDLYSFNDNELTDSKGRIKTHTINEIKGAVAASKTIPAYFKKLII
jgi:hypothetical protein